MKKPRNLSQVIRAINVTVTEMKTTFDALDAHHAAFNGHDTNTLNEVMAKQLVKLANRYHYQVATMNRLINMGFERKSEVLPHVLAH